MTDILVMWSFSFIGIIKGKPISNNNLEKNMAEHQNSNEVLLRVKSSSSAANLAAAIANNVYAGKDITLRAIGAAAVNQSMKAVAIAQSYVGPRCMYLSVRVGFTTVTMDDGDISALIFKIIVDQ